MKIIKLFDSFLKPLKPNKSVDEVKDLIQLLNDIFLEVSDDDFDIKVSHFSLIDRFSIKIKKQALQDTRFGLIPKNFKFIDIYETMLTAKSHMKEHGFYLDLLEAGNGMGDWWDLLYSTDLYEKGLGKLFDRDINSLELCFQDIVYKI